MCKREFLNYLRVREWQDFESQLRQVAQGDGNRDRPARLPTTTEVHVDTDGIHQALLSGLLSHIGLLEEREKETVRRAGGRCASTSAPAERSSRSSPAAGWPASSRST